MAEQKRNTRNTKSTKVQPVNDYGRIQPQAPELEEAVLGALMIEKEFLCFVLFEIVFCSLAIWKYFCRKAVLILKGE